MSNSPQAAKAWTPAQSGVIQLAAAVLLSFTLAMSATVVAESVSFDREVLPLLEKRCNECHHPEKQRGGLDLTRIETMLRGGDELGAAIVRGKPEASPLIQVLTGAKEPKMPEKGDALPATEIELLCRWIQEGAVDDSTLFDAQDVTFFEKEIRPVLVTRCFKCHAGEDAEHGLRLTSRHGILAGGLRGPAAVAGDASVSLLMKAIRHEGELKMPRNGDQLSDAQAAAFERWIANGLPWPSNEKVLARERQFTISDADREHWAFKPLPHDDANWSVDAALKPQHQKLGLTPAPEADRHRLLRRLTYDLIGYPPTPEEIAAFVSDKSSQAFGKVVARLLDSPHFGTRWGRHWLDYTRNGANAQSNRGPALDSERYAAWVARCFHEDRPWDWFARVHLAGDLMPAFDGGSDYSVDQALAAATPLNGPRTFEKIETQTFVLMDKLDEGVEFMGRSLMGISLECARCHDHKFDPVSQRDYYALLGFFQSSGFAPVPEKTASRQAATDALAQHDALVREQARLYGLIRHAGQTINASGRDDGSSGGRVKAWQEKRLSELAARQKRLLELKQEVLRAELTLAQNGGNKEVLAGAQAALMECAAALRDFQPATFDVRTMKHLHYEVGGQKDEPGLIRRATGDALAAVRTELEAQDLFWLEENKRWQEASRFGGLERDDPAALQLVTWDTRLKEIEATRIIDLRAPWLPPKLGHLLVRKEGGLRREEDLTKSDEEAKAAALMFNSDNPERALWLPPYIGDARLLQRGDALYPDQLVPRRTPVFFGDNQFSLEGSGRLQLAGWLTAKDSTQAALIARTVVNRVWQHLFGEALCRTPKELGRLGEVPELPELIDGLAARFVQSGWSQKALVREIVLSAAYRRSAIPSDESHATDEHNRTFARQNVRRLEVEPILNTMAWLRTGQRFESPAQRDKAVPSGAEYALHFDGPSPYDLIDRRSASITATQALFLMNSPVTAPSIAGDVLKRLGKSADASQVFVFILHRPPSLRELELAAPFPTLRDLAAAILCGNEAIYIE